MIRRIIRNFTKLNLHSDILSLGEIQQVIKSTVDTKENRFMNQIRQNKIDHRLWSEIKKQYIDIKDAIDMIKELSTTEAQIVQNDSQNQLIVRTNIYNYFMVYFLKRLDKLTFKELAIIIEQYAFANRFYQHFFREIENEIFDRIDLKSEPIHYKDVEKILWAYQHTSYGSAMLYNAIANVIKISQNEINPMNLGYYAYLFSKSPEKNDFKIYKLAEDRINDRIHDYGFNEAVRLAKYFFWPNIGSNPFQEKIEKILSDNMPNNKNMQLSTLVKLCKYTSKYYFKYNERALYNKLESASIELMDQMNDNQFSEVLWSYLRYKRGNVQLYENFQKQLNKRQKLLNIRQLTLLFYNSSKFIENLNISKQLYNIIKQRDPENIKPAYLIFIYLTCIKCNLPIIYNINQDKLKSVSIQVQMKLIQQLTNHLLDQNYLELYSNLYTALSQNQQLTNEYKITLAFIKIVNNRLIKDDTKLIYEINSSIPKYVYHSALYLEPNNETLHNILINLHSQHKNQIRYLFNQDQWVIISFSLLYQHVFDKQYVVTPELLEQAIIGLLEIDINMIDYIEQYILAVWLCAYIQKIDLQIINSKISQLSQNKQQDYIKQLAIRYSNNDYYSKQVQSYLDSTIKSQLKVDHVQESFINMFDQFTCIMLNNAHLVKIEDQIIKIGVIFVQDEDFINTPSCSLENILSENKETMMSLNKNILIKKFILEELFGWSIILLKYNEFQALSEIEKTNILNKVINIQINDTEEIQKGRQINFKEKLQMKRKSQQKYQEKDDDINI